jgi:hypothetical protein
MSVIKKFKKEMIRNSYLELEKEDVNEICEKNNQLIKEMVEKEFREYYDIIFPPEPVIEPESDIGEQTSTEEDQLDTDAAPDPESDEDKQLKKLYRQISLKTHPDKNDGIYKEEFMQAKSAYEKKNLSKLLKLASLLGCDLPEMSEEMTNRLEEENNIIDKSITQQKNTTAWAWENLKNDDEKRTLIKYILYSIGVLDQNQQ